MGLGQPQNSSQCCSAPANMRNYVRNPGLLTKVCGVSAGCGQQPSGLLQNPPLSGSWSGFTWALTSLPADTMDVLSFPDWTCSSYRLCSIRVQISFALLSFRKKAICFVYPCKCQKCEILKSLPEKLLSLKKRATEILILLSYCLMNLLSSGFCLA